MKRLFKGKAYRSTSYGITICHNMRRKNLRLMRNKRIPQHAKYTQIPFNQNKRTWANKFKDAFCGLVSSLKGQSSYH
ncbi:MAG: hypothetical protein LBJ00_15215, partial [Planctomycetaceae bacterium]|nr:hypothetical protein [Planctomycetaceae bacterium]